MVESSSFVPQSRDYSVTGESESTREKQIGLLRSDRSALRSQNVFLNFASRSFR